MVQAPAVLVGSPRQKHGPVETQECGGSKL